MNFRSHFRKDKTIDPGRTLGWWVPRCHSVVSDRPGLRGHSRHPEELEFATLVD